MSHDLAHSLALAAAALFLAACNESTPKPSDSKGGADTPATQKQAPTMPEPVEGVTMQCFGANECRGQTACNVPDGRLAAGSKGNACTGQNECRGKGWLLLSQDDCDAKGGQPL